MVGKVLGLVRLLRPVNCVMMGLAVLTGEVIAYGTLYFSPSLLGFATAFTLTGASMITNDYWDRSVDAVNAPSRPIVSGLISARLALFYAFILILIGLSSALLTGVLSFLIAAASLFVSLLYNYRGKRLGLVGNFMVSACISIPLVYGGFLYRDVAPLSGMGLLLFFDLMVFLANTGREVNKGIADVEGDRLSGARTVAIHFGLRAAAFVAAALYLSAVSLSVFPWLLGLVPWMYLPLVAVADAGFIASSFILLRDYSRESALRVKRMVLVWMLLGLLAFTAGVFG